MALIRDRPPPRYRRRWRGRRRQFPSAVAKLDLETGALVDRRCGLAFGLSEQVFHSGRSGPTICDVAR